MDDWISASVATPPDEIHLAELVIPAQANHYGTLFGPQALALLGKAAYLAAAGFARQPVVMARASRIDFMAPAPAPAPVPVPVPVPVGAALRLRARVSRVGRVDVRAAVDGATRTPPHRCAARQLRDGGCGRARQALRGAAEARGARSRFGRREN